MQLHAKKTASTVLAAAALLIHSLAVALPIAVFDAPLAAESPASSLLVDSSPVSAAAHPAGNALVSSLYRRVIEPVTGTILAGGLAVAGTMGVKQLAEVHHRNRKAAQNSTQEGYKNEYERDKDKETRRINYFEAKPGNGCYTVCGGEKDSHVGETDCSRASSDPNAPSSDRAIKYLFEDEDAWDDSDLAADEAVDVDYAVDDALKKSPLSSQSPLRTPYRGAPAAPAAPAAGGKSSTPSGASAEAPAKAPAAAAAAGKKHPNPDEIKHVTVGGGLIGKFTLAEKMRTRAQRKINTHIDAGGCVVVHNKINVQYGL
ncbi:hypothetical protein DFJ73DRAFT_796460 [Zopfochytrium polystomum]|nr:hypothetical protein DFJ73DRAFT_796460 [Zopfochytrium polystomum]